MHSHKICYFNICQDLAASLATVAVESQEQGLLGLMGLHLQRQTASMCEGMWRYLKGYLSMWRIQGTWHTTLQSQPKSFPNIMSNWRQYGIRYSHWTFLTRNCNKQQKESREHSSKTMSNDGKRPVENSCYEKISICDNMWLCDDSDVIGGCYCRA